MYSEDSPRPDHKGPENEQDQRKKTLKWLLEQDLSEPADSLFSVAGGDYNGGDLTEREAAVAGRPMIGGNPSADDLSAFVDEEIVLSEESGGNIYSEKRARDGADKAAVNGGGNGVENGIVAIDHRRRADADALEELSVADGTDILGLLDDDDIGTKPLSLRRSRKAQAPLPPSDPEPEATAVAEPAPQPAEPVPAPVTAVGCPGNVAAEMDATPQVETPVAATGPDAARADSTWEPGSFEPSAMENGAFETDASALDTSALVPGADELDYASAAAVDAPSPDGEASGEPEVASGGPLEDGDLPGGFEQPLALSPADTVSDDTMKDTGWLSDGAETIFDDSLLTEDELETGAFDPDFLELGDFETDALEPAILESSVLEPGAPEPGALQLDDLPETLDDVLILDEQEEPALGGELPGDLSALAEDDAGAGGSLSIETDAGDSPAAEQLAVDWLSAAAGADEDIDAREPAADVESHDVHSYVTHHSPPSDDSEFDAYLLRGEHLSDLGHDFDSLVVERTEGVVSVDPSLESDLDYHQDFSLPQDFNPRTVAALTRVVVPVMEELEAAVEARLAELSLPAGGVALDAMLAIDPLSRRQCVDEGYVPFPELGAQLPEALAELGDGERKALCVRLVLRDSGDTCNDLFRQGFAIRVDAPEVSLAVPATRSFPPGLDLDIGGVGTSGEFAVDVEPANDAGPAAASPVTELATEAESIATEEPGAIDGSWFDLSSGDEDDSGILDSLSAVSTSADDEDERDLLDPLSDIEEYDDGDMLALLSAMAPDDDSDTPAPPMAMETVEPALDDDVAAEIAADDSDRDISCATGDDWVGGDSGEAGAPDIFSAADLDDWDAELESGGDSADVEALLQSLGGEESDIGDICGVAVDEFDGGEDAALESLVQPPPAAAGDSGASAAQQTSATDDGELPAPAESGMAWCIPDNIRFNYTSHSGTEVFRDFLEAFLEEGAVELEKLEDAIGAWEKDIDSPAGTDVVPRVLHTLKGIAKGVGLQRYGTLIHNFETLLGALAKPAEGGEAAYFRIVNAWLDAAVQGFEHIQNTQSDVASELPQADGLAAPVQAAGAAASDAVKALDARDEVHEDRSAAPVRAQDKRLADEGAKVLAAQQTIRMTSEALDNLLNLNNQTQQLGVRASQSTYKSKRAGAELLARLSSVRSHITKIADRALQNVTARGSRNQSELDALEMDQYSELQEAASILREAIEDLDDLIHLANRQSASAESLLKQQASVITSLGSAIRDARVVPVSRLMPGLRRIVRTVGADLGKAVNFRVLNEIGKLDRDSHVCCQIILEHMVRNALDHGIEAPEQRRAAGKPEAGLVTIDVSKDGSDYLIRLSDDGRGMDPAALREAALERGLDIDVGALGDREALRLIFHKGFSTATRLSEISGRGVGMDIVLSELQQVGGDIDIDSTPGQGTTFTVRVPSNVNVNGALLVTAGETSYAIPLDGLIAVEHIPSDDFFRAVSEGGRLSVYDMDCEPAYLATLCSGAKLPDPESWGETVPVILAGSEERYMAIAVDDVAEALELVIRSMGAQFSQVPGVAGGATTADGQAIVALDLNALVRNLAASQLSAVPFEREKSERLLVLVVDDSRTQRMVATSQFDTLGVETVTAENGLVAIDMLNSTHRLPDVVLLDVEMPVKDGIQTLREIRKSERYKHLPVIMVTSRTGPKHRALAQEAGCNGYMGKPFNFPVLVEQIVQLTGHELQIN